MPGPVRTRPPPRLPHLPRTSPRPTASYLRTGALSWLFPRRGALVAVALGLLILVLVALGTFASSTGMGFAETLSGLFRYRVIRPP
ncbi:Iron ABC transporter permease OS=Streptomyces rimosus subsp. rimosus (strain ATCC / DSM 40260/ JCM 4667 / NRRL 2234) OX=1265868 GN=SRIM_038560 PE=3 SV=1 [Streptomyces rimosus subsp. rimosus]